MATKSFIQNFNLAMEHYQVPPDEIEVCKQLARADMETAEICYAALGKEIRGQEDMLLLMASGINGRIASAILEGENGQA